jgi:GNAT superfamily N-acetyltransferase
MDSLQYPGLTQVLALTPEQIFVDFDHLSTTGDVDIEVDGQKAGRMQLSSLRRDGLITVDFIEVSASSRGQGVATEALKQLKSWAKRGGYKGIYAEMIWQGSLKAFLSALGKPDFLGDDIHQYTVEEAMSRLSKTQPKKKNGIYNAGHIDGRWDF